MSTKAKCNAAQRTRKYRRLTAPTQAADSSDRDNCVRTFFSASKDAQFLIFIFCCRQSRTTCFSNWHGSLDNVVLCKHGNTGPANLLDPGKIHLAASNGTLNRGCQVFPTSGQCFREARLLNVHVFQLQWRCTLFANESVATN